MRLYDIWAPVYDAFFGRVLSQGRRRALSLLSLRPGERLFIPGVGTGLDLPGVPAGVETFAIDTSPGMLTRARGRAGANTRIELMDAQRLTLSDACFDAVLCNLILSVVPDGKAAMREIWRILRPGGRVAIFDKFVRPGIPVGRRRQLIGRVARVLGTDINRRLDDILADLPGLEIVSNEPSFLRGQYRVVLLRKAAEDCRTAPEPDPALEP